MKKLARKKKLSKVTTAVVTTALLVSSLQFAQKAQAGDTWPFKDDSAQGANQPSIHGYTSNQIANWSPSTDPYAEMLRSRVPLQTRIAPLAATQANPALNPNAKMITVAGDYGNAFIENAPYTNKFAQYHFSFWQYTDFYSYWHGTATAYTPPEYYDATAQADWTQKWFEFGILNIPNPTYTDAAHKNGVMSLAGIFFSNNDRGQQTYKQMLIKDEQGNFPVAAKLIEMARYYGYDGYFFNQEESGPNVATADIPTYVAFLKVLQQSGLYVQWYDSLTTNNGATTYSRTFNNNNISFLVDQTTKEPVTNSFFFDYGVNNTLLNSAKTYLSNLNTTLGTDYDIYDVGYAGIEAGGNRFTATNGTHLSNKLVGGIPGESLAMLGADFVHAGLDEDMGQAYPVSRRSENDYQWMTFLREQLWWSGPNVNPVNTAKSATNTVSDVYADNRYWPGVASAITERSVIAGNNFYSSFNTGHGLNYYVNGDVSNEDEWSNMSLQDIPVTWEWWEDTTGSRLAVDYDYGPEFKTSATRFKYTPVGGYSGGSSLVVSGALDADNFLRLYKTDLSVNANTKVSLTYDKSSADDSSVMSLGLVFADDPTNMVKVPLAGSGKQTQGWTTAQLDLGSYAGKSIAAMGLVFAPGQGSSISDYQVNVGQLRYYDGSAETPAAPTGLAIADAFADTNEMNVQWSMDADYTKIKQYNVYVNDVFVGGKYDDRFYIKDLPAKSGTIKVAAVGADGVEGPAAQMNYDLNATVSGISVSQADNGDMTVHWSDPQGAAGPVNLDIRSVNWITTEAPVSQQIQAEAGSTSAVIPGLPINGDDYKLTITIGSGKPVTVSGTFVDKTILPYAEKWSWNGNTLSLPMPNTRDWRYMYVYQDGTPKSFAVTYLSGASANKPMIIRGRTTKASLSFASTAQVVSVVMEDYAGNTSEPLYLRGLQTITLDANGGQSSTAAVQGVLNTTLTEPTGVTRAGYELEGWYNNGIKWNFASDKVAGDMTLQAKWSLLPPTDEWIDPAFVQDLPAARDAALGEETTLYVQANGDIETIRWESKLPDEDEWQTIQSSTSPVYTFTPQASDDGKLYRVVLVGKGEENPVTRTGGELKLTVQPVVPAPTIPTVSASANPAIVGQSVTFTSVSSAVYGDLSYQWYKDGAPIEGAAADSYTKNAVTMGDAGNYKVSVTNTVYLNGRAYTSSADSQELVFAVNVAGGPVTPPADTPATNTPEPPASGKTALKPEQLKAEPQNGSITIQLEDSVTVVDLPIAADEYIGNNKLVLRTGSLQMTLSSAQLKQLKSGATEWQLADGTFRLSIDAKPADTTGIKTGAGVSVKGKSVQFSLSIADAKGNLQASAPISEPVVMSWEVESGFDPDLLGVYQVDADGTLHYLGGEVKESRLTAELPRDGVYMLLEYNKTFSDIPAGYWAENTIRKLSAKHLIDGVSETSFDPSRRITRAEFVKLMASVLKLSDNGDQTFEDVAPDAWYAGYVSAMVKAGIINGRSDNRFEPNAQISREEIVTILMRAYALINGQSQPATTSSYADQGDISAWAADSVSQATALGLVQGRSGDRFAPKAAATRAEAAQFILNYIK
ncbi:S-layer homology domain-containing protein [Cohnella sp. GCM10012308]|uniref:endo-beta-N-acetylglucosaminidase n=1 Tax=Cohnella sp. GCM10012308 TaxID=3317329 RepID=UPI00362355FC